MPLDGQGTKLVPNESRERGMKAPNKKDQNLEKLVSLAKPLISEEGWEKGVIPLGSEANDVFLELLNYLGISHKMVTKSNQNLLLKLIKAALSQD